MTAFDALLADLARDTPAVESPDLWPAGQFQKLADAGVLGWVIPREHGGAEVPPLDLIRGYDRLAAACLMTTFVLTQRNGACQRIAAAEGNDALRRELLPDLAAGRTFATVGISHLSTSRQHLRRPAVRVERIGGDYVLDGEVPWVTGAPHADVIVTGGTVDDGRQVLIALPTDAAGVACGPPARLLALTASCTAEVRLDGVCVPARYLLAGPVEGVMRRGAGGTGSVATSALAVGLSERATALLEREAEQRADLQDVAQSFRRELDTLRGDLYAAAAGGPAAEAPQCRSESIRQRSNALVLRVTQSLLAASKGTGFVAGHPAERSAREALFFLVWSCPQPVVSAALRGFACLAE